ncbi:MAG: MBL fold metallo-hydrolase [Neisseria sp.]|nr:MBL fold metallo-hydrolase [Neisseria sp.]
MMRFFASLLTAAALMYAAPTIAAQCTSPNLDVVILGSGGPELDDGRASTGYLVRENGKARFLIDFGAGSALNFERAGGRIEDLQAILFTHFHVDHSNDLPALVKAAYFSDREDDLPIFGPSGNAVIPSTPQFIERQFGEGGVYPYLSDFLDGSGAFRLRVHAVNADTDNAEIFRTTLGGFTLKAVPVAHGLMPSLAWRIEKDGCALTVSGDTSNEPHTLDRLVGGSSLFIAHNAAPEHTHDSVAAHLHMMPSEIGRIAAVGQVKSLLLSHLMHRTEKVKPQTLAAVRTHFDGKTAFAEDCDIYSLASGEKTGSCVKE